MDVNGCPIASNVTYEEYDHRKQPRLTGPWIGLTPLDTINASKTNYRSSQPGNDSQTQIEQKSLDRKKLIAECLKSRPTGYRRKIQREPALSKTPESLLDAIEDSINTAAQDHRECDVSLIFDDVFNVTMRYQLRLMAVL